MVGRRWQAGDGARHGQQGRAQNVQPADLGHRGGADADFDPPRAGGLVQRAKRRLAPRRVEFLRIIEQRGEVARDRARQHHGGGKHGAGERATPHLVHAGDAAGMGAFESVIGHPPA